MGWQLSLSTVYFTTIRVEGMDLGLDGDGPMEMDGRMD